MIHSSSGFACPVLAVLVSAWLSAIVAQEPSPVPAAANTAALDRRGIAERLGAPAELPDVLSTVAEAERQRQLRRAELIPVGDRDRLLRGGGSERARIACAFDVLGRQPKTSAEHERELVACEVLLSAFRVQALASVVEERLNASVDNQRAMLRQRLAGAAAAILRDDAAPIPTLWTALQTVRDELAEGDRRAVDAWSTQQLPHLDEPGHLVQALAMLSAAGDLGAAQAVVERLQRLGDAEARQANRMLAAVARVMEERRDGDSDAIHALRRMHLCDRTLALAESRRLHAAHERHALPATLLGLEAFFEGRSEEAERFLVDALGQPGQDESTRGLVLLLRWLPKARVMVATEDAALEREFNELVEGCTPESTQLLRTMRAMGWPRQLARETIGEGLDLALASARALPDSVDAQRLLCGAVALSGDPEVARAALAVELSPALRAHPELAWLRASIGVELALRGGATTLSNDVEKLLTELAATADGERDAQWLRGAFQWSLGSRQDATPEQRREARTAALAAFERARRGGSEWHGFGANTAYLVAACALRPDGEPVVAAFEQLGLGDEADEVETYVPALCALARCDVRDARTMLEQIGGRVQRPRLQGLRHATLAEIYAAAGRRDAARREALAALDVLDKLRGEPAPPAGLAPLGSVGPSVTLAGLRVKVRSAMSFELLVLPDAPDEVRLRVLARND
jgi:hypothetical protein